MKRGRKKQVILELFQQGYDPKTVMEYLKGAEAQQKYGKISASKGYIYPLYKEFKEGKITVQKPSEVRTEREPMKKAPLKISVTGEKTPPEQLQIIQAGEGITPQQQMLTGEQMSGFWQSIAYNYPEKHRWDDGANKFLGAIWAPVFNKWISASSENFLLGFAIICTIIIVLKPTILSIRDWQESRKKKGGKTPLQKRTEKVEKELKKE